MSGSVMLSGEDGSVGDLLVDVLLDAGFSACAPGRPPDVVLAIVSRGETVLHRLLAARQGTYPAPVVVVLPFSDRRLSDQALRLGAAGAYAPGEPIRSLVETVSRALRRPTGC